MRRGIIGAIAVAAIAVAVVALGQSQQAGPPQVEMILDEAQEEASGFLDQTQQVMSEIAEQAQQPFESSRETAVGTLEAAEGTVEEAVEEAAEEAEEVVRAMIEAGEVKTESAARLDGGASWRVPEETPVAFVYNGGEGSRIGLPIVRETMDAYFQLKNATEFEQDRQIDIDTTIQPTAQS